MIFWRTENPFTNLRQYGFCDPIGHDLAMCQDFIDAETQHAELLAACVLMKAMLDTTATFHDVGQKQFDEAMDATEAILTKIEGGKK